MLADKLQPRATSPPHYPTFRLGNRYNRDRNTGRRDTVWQCPITSRRDRVVVPIECREKWRHLRDRPRSLQFGLERLRLLGRQLTQCGNERSLEKIEQQSWRSRVENANNGSIYLRHNAATQRRYSA